jgi:galactofuranosylgalactofuranosylrhamnosyl-N-acetylglucosaminyl-diphospho-decaprenol beta-1,5/1,6-galactofuranosyltransferase
MKTLSRVRLPCSDKAPDLYVQGNYTLAIDEDDSGSSIALSQSDMLSFNTYFNSLYETFYQQYTTITTVYYWLKLEGSFTVSIWREVYGGSDRQLISQQQLLDCQVDQPMRLEIPDFIQSKQSGRIYFELHCLSDRGIFRSGEVVTDLPANREISLGIISCTYKKERYIKNTVSTILEDPGLQNKSFKIFVVDNGKTLENAEFENTKTQLIPNRNVGGSGGFARGLVEALQEESYSHFLFMDDDIELDSEVIYRLFSLYEYAKSEFAIAGGMLDLHKKHLLFEAGAHYATSQFKGGFEPFEISSLKTDLDLRKADSLNALLQEEPIDYGAFWFFAFPKPFVEAMGLPLPFFIKGDDIEFGLRISRQLQEKIVSFPAIAVWHEPFYAKFPVWDSYYYFRNILITHAMHGSLSYLTAIKDMTARLIYTLLFFDYNSAGMLIKAFEDYIQGPDFIKNHDPENLHTDIVRLSKFHQNQSVDYTFSPPPKTPIHEASALSKIASLFTLNGHFLPDFLIQDQAAFVWYAPGFPGQRSRAFAKKRVLIFKEKADCLYQYELDKKAGLTIFFHWVQLILRSSAKWNQVTAAWKDSAQELVSLVFWQKYLQLKK